VNVTSKALKKTHDTKERIISTALVQSASLGLENISLGGLAREIGMSKSGLFAHFKSKESLQLAVVHAALDLFHTTVIEPAMASPKGLPRLHALFNQYLDWMTGASGLVTCPFTVFIQEYDSRPGPIRDLLVKSELQWRDIISNIAVDAINSGHIDQKVCPGQIAFELIGTAFSYQVSHCLLNAKDAKAQAEAAFDRIIMRADPQAI